QDQLDLVLQPVAGDTVEQGHGMVDQFLGARLDLEAQPLLEAGGPQDARRVVHKAQAVQHADNPGAQVGLATVEVQKLPEMARVQADSQRVDREIAPVDVVLDAAALDLRQHSRRVVELGAGAGEIDVRGQVIKAGQVFDAEFFRDAPPYRGVEQPFARAEAAV